MRICGREQAMQVHFLVKYACKNKMWELSTFLVLHEHLWQNFGKRILLDTPVLLNYLWNLKREHRKHKTHTKKKKKTYLLIAFSEEGGNRVVGGRLSSPSLKWRSLRISSSLWRSKRRFFLSSLISVSLLGDVSFLLFPFFFGEDDDKWLSALSM